MSQPRTPMFSLSHFTEETLRLRLVHARLWPPPPPCTRELRPEMPHGAARGFVPRVSTLQISSTPPTNKTRESICGCLTDYRNSSSACPLRSSTAGAGKAAGLRVCGRLLIGGSGEAFASGLPRRWRTLPCGRRTEAPLPCWLSPGPLRAPFQQRSLPRTQTFWHLIL